MSKDKQTLLCLYTRKECCLCNDLLKELEPWGKKLNFNIKLINIDESVVLTERFAARIPLLAAGDTEICQYHLDEHALVNFFKQSN